MSEAGAAIQVASSRPSLLGAGGSALVARVVSQGAQFLLFIVAARVLTPTDFGLYSLVAVGSALLFLIAAAGWREFIMGWSGSSRAVNQAITYSIMSGYAMTIVGVSIAAVLAEAFQAPVLSLLALMLSACVFLTPITTALSGILVRSGRVPAFSMTTIVSEIAGLAAGVYGLLAGWGVLALGASKLVVQSVSLVGMLYYARWPLRLVIRGGYGADIYEISRHILANRLISFVYNNAATFIVAAYLGPASVGFFRAAERVVSSLSELVFEPLRLIAWMTFRRAADNARTRSEVKEELAKEAGVFLPLLLVFASPIFIGLTMISEALITVLLGETWAPAGAVAAILAVSALLIAPSIATEPLLTMTGRIRLLPPVALFNAIVAIAVLVAFTRYGLVAAALARLAAALVVAVTNIWLQIRFAESPWWGTLKRAAPVYSALIALVLSIVGARLLMAGQEPSLTVQLLLEIVIGAVVYFGLLVLVRPSYLRTALWL